MTDVLEIGIEMRWISVSVSPIAKPAKPFGARSSVAPRMTIGVRSHQALKIAMVAWNRPTLECTAAAIALPVTLA